MTFEVAASIVDRVNPLWLVPEAELASYGVDGLIPSAAVRPPSVEALSEVVALANEEGLATIPLGGMTQRSLGNPPRRYDLALDTRSLDRLVQYEPADLTVTVEAGMPLARLGEILAAEGQFLPLETPRPSTATIGGMLAAASFGPLSLSYGLPRDWLIGVKVVNADGRVTKGGGRVVKNVTGYDMNKLYSASLGTLGVIVEASFKVAPRPAASTTLKAGFASLEDAMTGAWGLLEGYGGPDALTLLNASAGERLGLANPGYLLLARFLGRERVVRGRASRAEASLKASGAEDVDELDTLQAGSTWQRVVDMPWVDEGLQLAIRCSALPSEVGRLLGRLERVGSSGVGHGLTADVGTGLVRSLSWGEAQPDDLKDRLELVTREMRRSKAAWVVERCPPELKHGLDVWGPPPPGLEIMRRLKLALDPHGILNPGRFVGGL